MSEHLSTESYKGVRDFYPADWERMEALFTTLRATLATWGYAEYNASPLERAELYESKTSEEIVNEQTYTFIDRGDRRVTLRPEMTPTLARMVAGKRRELAMPLRWFSIPNVFRYERPQRGRLREHYQLNVDLLGVSGLEADAEVVTLASSLLTAFGAKEGDFVIRISSRPLLNAACRAAGLKGEAVKRYIHLLDRKNKMPATEFEHARAALTGKDPLAIIEEAGQAPEVAEEKRALMDLVESLAARGVTTVVFDASITRGFDYYTGIVFEVFDTNPANPRALFGGGRYDGLVGMFGGDSIPAVGFGMGDVTLADFIETHTLAPGVNATRPQLYLGTPAAGDIPAAQAFAATLRAKGCRIFVNITEKSLGDQIKDADRRSIPLFAAYGRDEVASGTVRMKVLATGIESAFSAGDLPLHPTSGS